MLKNTGRPGYKTKTGAQVNANIEAIDFIKGEGEPPHKLGTREGGTLLNHPPLPSYGIISHITEETVYR